MMTPLMVRNRLTKLGWRITGPATYRAAVQAFQYGWALGPPLVVDGKAGPATQRALAVSQARRLAGQPTASDWFSFAEFSCRCAGRYSGCRRIWVGRELLTALDRYRERVARPVRVVSGYRCASHNRAVGGASSSQHLYGAAADVEPVLNSAEVAELRRFSGIGFQRATGKVRHVDVRHAAVNTTSSTPARPMLWAYLG